MLKIGLTGGIASGKSAASEHFARLGATVIDADRIARQLVEPGSPLLEEIGQKLGDEFITPDGRLARKELRARIFSDPKAKAQLESILHPAIWQEMENRLATSDAPYAVLVIPLLAESDWSDRVDRILVIDLPEPLQIQRVCKRDNLTIEEAEQILSAQASRQQRLQIADDIILNDADLDVLHRQVEALHQRYLALAANV